jgi:hypothetical protein
MGRICTRLKNTSHLCYRDKYAPGLKILHTSAKGININ